MENSSEILSEIYPILTSKNISSTNLISNLISLLLFTFAFVAIWFIKQSKGGYGRPQRKIPGPTSLPLIGAIHHFTLPGTDIFKVATNWCLKYGKIFHCKLLLADFYVISHPPYLQKLLESSNRGYLNKPRKLYDVMAGEVITNGILFSDYPIWSHSRKIFSRGFTYRGIQYQIENTNLHIRRMIKKLLDRSQNTENISKLLQLTALDIILHSIIDLDITTAEERDEFHKQLGITKNGVSLRIRQPWLFLKPIYFFHPARAATKRSNEEIIKFMNTIIQRYKLRKANAANENAFHDDDDDRNGIKRVKSIMEEMIDAGFSDNQIFQDMTILIYAGHETSIWSINYLLLRLAQNPEIQERCRNEVDELFESKGLSIADESSLVIQDLNKLEYLDRCVKENLRTTPVVPSFARRLDEPLKLEEDLVLEKGQNVTIIPWAIHRNPEIYPEPEKFDPDRFLPEEVKKRHPYSYLPFSAGLRNCIGYKVAPLTIKLVVAWVLRYFVVESNDKWEDMELVYDVTVTPKKDPNLVFNRRGIK